MPARQRRSRETKAGAVGIALSVGVTEAERQTGIPKESIQYWVNAPEFAHLRTRARDAVAEEFWTGIQVGLKSVLDGFRDPDAPLRDKAQALGVLYDRFALLTGGATGRTETRDITGTLSDADLVAVVREAERITSGSGVAEATAEPPAGERL